MDGIKCYVTLRIVILEQLLLHIFFFYVTLRAFSLIPKVTYEVNSESNVNGSGMLIPGVIAIRNFFLLFFQILNSK